MHPAWRLLTIRLLWRLKLRGARRRAREAYLRTTSWICLQLAEKSRSSGFGENWKECNRTADELRTGSAHGTRRAIWNATLRLLCDKYSRTGSGVCALVSGRLTYLLLGKS